MLYYIRIMFTSITVIRMATRKAAWHLGTVAEGDRISFF